MNQNSTKSIDDSHIFIDNRMFIISLIQVHNLPYRFSFQKYWKPLKNKYRQYLKYMYTRAVSCNRFNYLYCLFSNLIEHKVIV